MTVQIMKTELAMLAGIVAEKTGLHFSIERLPDLERGIRSAAPDLGYSDIKSCVEWLLMGTLTREHIEVLADHLTIGETYFFRDKAVFNFLKNQVLPELINSRKENERHLRIWSAGCCTGEEPYSIAIILYEMISDLADWNITIIATDINRRFLRKAVEGVYTEWSFRDTMPVIQKRYFHPEGDGRFRLIPSIRNMVEFSFLNLSENSYPSVLNNTNAMDIIFCRNVLMYFTGEQAINAANRLYLSAAENGWLMVSPSEVSQIIFSRFETVNIDGMFFYRKSRTSVPYKEILIPDPAAENRNWQQAGFFRESPPAGINFESGMEPLNSDVALIAAEEIFPDGDETPTPADEPLDLFAEAAALFKRGYYEESVKKLMNLTIQGREGIAAMALMARAYANLGRLIEARRWCENAVAGDKLNAENYYLLASILLEQEETALAERALNQALYADPEFAPAHFTLGNIANSQRKFKKAQKHFKNALHILSSFKPEDIFPGSDGMTAGGLSEIIDFNLKVTA